MGECGSKTGKGKQPKKGASSSQRQLWVTDLLLLRKIRQLVEHILRAILSEEQGIWSIYTSSSLSHSLRSAECEFWRHYLPAFLAYSVLQGEPAAAIRQFEGRCSAL